MSSLDLPETSPVLWFVLVHSTHGRTTLDHHMHDFGYPRMLNITGRWSSRPSREVPVLVWRDRVAAEAALLLCREARGDGVVISSFGSSGLDLGKELTLYTESHRAALQGYLPYGPIQAAKVEAARLKALASAAYLVGRATQDERLLRRARELSPKAGSGAPDYLTGKAGGAIVQGVLAGELEADALVTPEVLRAGVLLADALIADRTGRPGRFGG